MQIGKRIFLLGIIVLFAFQTALVIGNYFESAKLKTPFGWQDEGYVLGPALTVYEHGWKEYRCRGDQIICYGAVHTFFDVLLLKALPESWVKESPLLQPPGPNWFYQAKYPNAFEALRLFRVFIAAVLIAVIGGLVSRSSRSWMTGVVSALALSGFETFRSARMGLKNDFSFALFLVLFLFLANKALSATNPKRSRSCFIYATIIGVAGVSVKFGMILPLLALIPTYILSRHFGGTKWKSISSDLALGSICAIGAFFFTNPAFTVNLGEANWFSSFISATGRVPTGSELSHELFKVLLPSVWLLPILVIAAFPRLKTKERQERIRWIYLMGIPALWAVLTWKSAFDRSAYYLPILVWICVCFAWAPRLNRFVLTFLLFALSMQSAGTLVSEWGVWNSQKLVNNSTQEPWRLFECEGDSCSKKVWIVDRVLRSAIPSSVAEANVLFFDSMSDSPAELVKLVDQKWPNLSERESHVLTACWENPPSNSDSPLEYASPAADAWSKLLADECRGGVKLDARSVFAFENGWRAKEFHHSAFPDLASKVSKKELNHPLSILRSGLSPRMLRGAWQGTDSWYAPVILTGDAVLEGDFFLPPGAQMASLSVESTCKGRGEIHFEVGGEVAWQSADTRALLCSKRSWVCRFGLEGWWTERMPLPPISVKLPSDRSDPLRIRISVSGAEKDRCRISLGTIRFTEVQAGMKVDL